MTDIPYTGKYLRCKYCDIKVQKELTDAVKLKSVDPLVDE